MIGTLRASGSFSPAARVLFVNQLGINIGFYMLMPYLADHLTAQAGMAIWTAGLVLGLRNVSQQGMFLVGGTMADRLGYRPLIMAGCALRTVAFAMFALSAAVPAVITAAVLTGFAGALFNPAARAYLAHEAGERKVEAFALFNVYYQTGILVGPLIGMALISLDFRIMCLTAAAVFAALTVLQWRHLPPRTGAAAGSGPVLADWREAISNRTFSRFAVTMFAYYALSYQIYLGLPLEVRRLTGSESGVPVLYVISALLGIFAQLPVTAWCERRWRPAQAMSVGLALMGLAFTLLIPADHLPGLVGLMLVIACVTVLTLGTLLVFPFEMATIARLAGERLVGTYYGLYNLISGIGILIGNLLIGLSLDVTNGTSSHALPWLFLALAGLASAYGMHALHHSGRLTEQAHAQPALHKP
ncbi:MDR family MFS transporter [Planotetraspora kaengkrachanensis]|uniref:Putative ABC transporter, permease protein n=1 Tax=Planotetraspora kaengkrachanensis TaxID=575193 RepID=A0A8J3PQV3_9ACTN|nr:MFS transporter [Planotetraspora kaengkrachanensis]GIG77794.1 putative ABC transporter, permease protein [Planotetraspora kaengkrachanensis]